jgi:UDP-N-acetylglucosamine diphosphorylase/glucosamine-1-phosphate N-acetyltransferase
MNIILHDLDNHLVFAPLTLTRPVGNLRMGIWTNDERWNKLISSAKISYATEEYLSHKFPLNLTEDNTWVNAAVIPDEEIAKTLEGLQQNQALYVNDTFVAARSIEFNPEACYRLDLSKEDFVVIEKRWHLYQKNGQVIQKDYDIITAGRESFNCSETNTVIGNREHLFIDEGASLEGVTLNLTNGPIYIGKHAEIMEGTVVRGPLAMANHSVLKLSTKVYGPTSIGNYCKVGGEVNNVIFQAYSNKGHDGFLGNSVIGEWCNIGADTNSSNLKNNYGNVKTYDFETQAVEQTDVQFMGLFMGDHSKTGINTMLNTATVIGVSSTIFSAGFPPKYIPHFSWGGNEDSPVYDLEKAIEAANNMMKRRGEAITSADRIIFEKLYPLT